MKILFAFTLILISHFSYAQETSNAKEIYNSVEELNSGSVYEVYKYDEHTNSMYYQMFFPDVESFVAFTHFKNVESIFTEAFRKLDSSGTLQKVISLGVSEMMLVIKSEKNGEVLESKLLSLTEMKTAVNSKV